MLDFSGQADAEAKQATNAMAEGAAEAVAEAKDEARAEDRWLAGAMLAEQ